MSSRNPLRNIFSGGWIIALFAVFAMLTGSNATPSPGIVISDQIVGTTSETFFVIRTTTLRPPTYYAYRKRVELVELSIATGKIEQQCLVRETAYEYDFEAPQETWEKAELASPDCQVFTELSKRGANYIEPESIGPDYYEFRLDAEGVAFREADLDDPRPWQPMLTLAEIKTRAAQTTIISKSVLSWQTDDDGGGTFSIFDPDGEFETLPEMCELNPAPFRALRAKWMFLKFVCWSGNDDVDGAIFYMPVNDPFQDG